jgi:hypothetical protein
MTDRLLTAAFSPELLAALERLVDERVATALDGLHEARRRGFVTVAEAAIATGLSELAIRAQVKRGRLYAKRLGTRILVDVDSIEGASG